MQARGERDAGSTDVLQAGNAALNESPRLQPGYDAFAVTASVVHLKERGSAAKSPAFAGLGHAVAEKTVAIQGVKRSFVARTLALRPPTA